MVNFTAYVNQNLFLAAASIELSYLSLWILIQNSHGPHIHICYQRTHLPEGCVGDQSPLGRCTHLCTFMSDGQRHIYVVYRVWPYSVLYEPFFIEVYIRGGRSMPMCHASKILGEKIGREREEHKRNGVGIGLKYVAEIMSICRFHF